METSSFLPMECLVRIFLAINPDDYRTLHSAILVNRQWCKSGMPTLWRKPFNCDMIAESKLFKIIPVYLTFINIEDYKLKLKLGNIPSQPKPAFEYPAFLRELNYYNLYRLVLKWSSLNNIFYRGQCEFDIDGTEIDTGDTHEERCFQITNEICKVLINLSKIDLEHRTLEYLNTDLPSSLKNKSIWFEICAKKYISAIASFPSMKIWLSSLRKLTCNDQFNDAEFFKAVADSCHCLEDLIVAFGLSNQKKFDFSRLIKVQGNLKNLELTVGDQIDLSRELEVLSLGKIKSSLRKIEIFGGMVPDNFDLKSLGKCQNLERLSFSNFSVTSVSLKSLAIAQYPNLRYLEFNGIEKNWNYDPRNAASLELEAILINTNVILTDLNLFIDLRYCPTILKTIASHCPNLVNFGTFICTDQQIQDLLSLVKTSRLKSLTIPRPLLDDSRLFKLYKYFPQIATCLPFGFKVLNADRWILLAKYLRGFLDNAPSSISYLSWACDGRNDIHQTLVQNFARKQRRKINYFNITETPKHYCVGIEVGLE
ncbi:hypothetical protein G9A89_016917 [Geosiphon pyriformis]|nr:hypothetical protein G9A89_016917 [Geosiphon pyriformis]